MDPLRRDIAEFSRPVDLVRLGDNEVKHEIEANEAERAALADRFGLIALDSLRATLRLRRVRGGGAIRLAGVLAADLAQACVVTLEPVRQQLRDEFEVLYSGDATLEESVVGSDPDIAWPEPLPDGPLDLGEAVAQQLSLALDPYPRAEGVELDSERDCESRGSTGPLAGLEALKKRGESSR